MNPIKSLKALIGHTQRATSGATAIETALLVSLMGTGSLMAMKSVTTELQDSFAVFGMESAAFSYEEASVIRIKLNDPEHLTAQVIKTLGISQHTTASGSRPAPTSRRSRRSNSPRVQLRTTCQITD